MRLNQLIWDLILMVLRDIAMKKYGYNFLASDILKNIPLVAKIS